MHFNLLLDHLEEQLTKYGVAFTRDTLINLAGPCTTMPYLTITSTQLTVAVNTNGVHYGRIRGKLERRRIWRKTGHYPPIFDTIQEYGYELTDEQTKALVAMLIAQDLQPEYVI